MGGETIVHILEQCSWKNEVHLILQPMTKIPTLRQWLAAQGFGWREHVIAEGEKFYVILDARYDGISRTLRVVDTCMVGSVFLRCITYHTIYGISSKSRNRYSIFAKIIVSIHY